VTGDDGSRFIDHPIVLDDEEREMEGKSLQTFASLKNWLTGSSSERGPSERDQY
jgi:hypothetical protein